MSEVGDSLIASGTKDPVHMEVHSDTVVSTIDPVHMEIPDELGIKDPVHKEVHSDTGASTMDPVNVEVPDELGIKDPVHMEVHSDTGASTMDSVNVEVHSDTGASTMDSVNVEVHSDTGANSMDPVHVEVPDELGIKDPVHKDLKDEDEAWVKILSFLDPADIAKFGATSRRSNKLSKSPDLWQKLTIDVAQINHHYQSLEALIQRATKLKYIKITDENAITFDEDSFVNGMPPDGDMINFDENAMATLIEKAMPTLKGLSVGNNCENDDEIENDTTAGDFELDIELKNKTIVKFGRLSQLESLELCGNDISTSGMKAISKLKNLKVLKIPGWCCKIGTKKTDLNFLFQESKNLRVVDLSHHDVTNESLSILAKNNPNLEELTLYGCKGLNVGNLDVGSSMPNLRHLSLKTTDITKKSLLNMVKNCTQLSLLNLKFCHDLKNGFLNTLKTNCPNLENLNLGYLPPILKNADLLALSTQFKKLKALDLSGCSQVNEDFLQALANQSIQIELHSNLL